MNPIPPGPLLERRAGGGVGLLGILPMPMAEIFNGMEMTTFACHRPRHRFGGRSGAAIPGAVAAFGRPSGADIPV